MCSQWLKCGLWILICMELTWPFSLVQSRAGGLHDDVWIGVTSSNASRHEGRKKVHFWSFRPEFVLHKVSLSAFYISMILKVCVHFLDVAELAKLFLARFMCSLAFCCTWSWHRRENRCGIYESRDIADSRALKDGRKQALCDEMQEKVRHASGIAGEWLGGMLRSGICE